MTDPLWDEPAEQPAGALGDAVAAAVEEWAEYEWQEPARDQYDKGYARGYENALRMAAARLAAVPAAVDERAGGETVESLRAEVEHWKAHAEEAGRGFAQVCRDAARISARNVQLVEECERLRGVECPGIAHRQTNGAACSLCGQRGRTGAATPPTQERPGD